MKIRFVGAGLFYADRLADRDDEANNCFRQLRERAEKLMSTHLIEPHHDKVLPSICGHESL